MKTNAQLLLLLIGIFFLVVIARSKIRSSLFQIYIQILLLPKNWNLSLLISLTFLKGASV